MDWSTKKKRKIHIIIKQNMDILKLFCGVGRGGGRKREIETAYLELKFSLGNFPEASYPVYKSSSGGGDRTHQYKIAG